MSQPLSLGAGLRQAAFEQILAVEMRALAIGRGAGVNDDRLVCLIHAMQIRHRRIEREEVVELERRRLAVERERVVAAQRHPIRIADRRDGGEPVERAAQDDGEKARIAAFGVRELRQMRPGEQRAGGQQQFAARGCMQSHGHLRKNSGAMTRSASAWLRLSARATVWRVSAEASGPSPLSSSASGSAPRHAAGKFVGDIDAVRHAVDPGRFGVGLAVRRRRPPQRLAERGLRIHDAADRDIGLTRR